MTPSFSRLLTSFLASVVSVLVAFFGVFLVLFADIFGVGQRIAATAYVLGLYLLATTVMTLMKPNDLRRWQLTFVLPAFLFVLLLFASEPSMAGAQLLTLLVAVAGIWGGTNLGRYLRLRKQPVATTRASTPYGKS